jgi:hypothetical protein
MADAVVKDGRVYMRDDQGRAFSVPEAEARTELASGARLETPGEFSEREIRKQRETAGQQLLTAGEGAVRGATLGLGTYALTEALGDDYRQAALERQSINPGIATIGESIGAAAPLLATAGTGALARAASYTPATLGMRAGIAAEKTLGAAAARALGLGGEGAGLLSRAAASGVRLGVGGAVDAGLYGLGGSLADSALEGVPWTADRALAGLQDGALYGLVSGSTFGAALPVAGALGRKMAAAMAEGKGLRGAVEEWSSRRRVLRTVGDEARVFQQLTNDGTNPGELKAVGKWLQDNGIPTSSAREAADALKPIARRSSEAIAATAKAASAANVAVDLSPVASIVRERIDDLAQSGTRSGKAATRKLSREFAFLDQAPTATFERIWKDSEIVGAQIAKEKNPALSAQLEVISDSLGKSLDDALVGAPDMQATWRAAQKDRRLATVLGEGAEREAARAAQQAHSAFGEGTQSAFMGALTALTLGGGAPAAIMSGLAIGAGKRFVQARGAAALSRVADAVANTVVRIDEASKALARGEVGRGAAHARELYDNRDVPETIAARSLAHLAGATKDRDKQYEAVSATLAEQLANPEAEHARISKAIEPFAKQQPEIALQMAQQLSGDYAWLRTKVPSAMGNKQSLTPQAEPRPIPTPAKQKLVNYATALADPVSVIEDMSRGRVNWDGIEALKERRPDLWEGMRQSVIFACAQSTETLPYKRKIMLSLAFDFQADPSLGNVAGVQASGQVPTPEQPPGAGTQQAPPVRAPAISSSADDVALPRGLGEAA